MKITKKEYEKSKAELFGNPPTQNIYANITTLNFKELQKKYPAVNLNKIVEDRILFYRKRPFQKRTKRVWIEEIKEFLELVNNDFEDEKEKSKVKENVKISEDVLKKFQEATLLQEIKQELSKDHLQDDNVKMTVFFVAVSGLLNNPKKRISMALTGDSSVGKDNVIKTTLKHMPDGSFMFLTGATQPAIEDEAVYVPILALSEMNLFSETGANKSLLEVVKQRTEGGTSSIKKDAVTGFRTTKYEKTEQGTVFYNTVEAERDSQSETRFLFGNVEADETKIKTVNLDTTEKYSNIDKLLQNTSSERSWIKEGITYIKREFGDCEILIPYANVLMKKIGDVDIIDHSNPRSMRDVKRLLSLTSAVTFLHSLQRKVIEYRGRRIIISIPDDLLNTLDYSKEFFNTTYEGLDERLNRLLKEIDSSLDEWVARDIIQKKLKISTNTIKVWQSMLEAQGLIEWIKGSDLNYKLDTRAYDGNKIYLKRYQKGIKKMLIRYQKNELKKLLENEKVSMIDKEGISSLVKKRYQFKTGIQIPPKNSEIPPKNSEIDTFGLIPFEDSGIKEALEDEQN